MVKSPELSVIVLTLVPFKETVTPASGVPSWLFTCPVIFLSGAGGVAAETDKLIEAISRMKEIFFTIDFEEYRKDISIAVASNHFINR
jgi:hypothetical protein